MGLDANGWPFDASLARQLGFVYFAVGGSRSYQRERIALEEEIEDRDWDLVGIVRSKDDIISLVLRNAAQLNDLLCITKAEHVEWQILRDVSNDSWEVLRYSGWDRNSTKRSLKICSEDQMFRMLAQPFTTEFGVLSARAVRMCRHRHPLAGHYFLVYQPLKIAEGLHVLHDADLISPNGRLDTLNPGVTFDLLFTSTPIFVDRSALIDRLLSAFLHKWMTLSRSHFAVSFIQLLYHHQDFEDQFNERLRAKILEAATSPKLNGQSPPAAEASLPDPKIGTDDPLKFVFDSLRPGFWEAQHHTSDCAQPEDAYGGPTEYRPNSMQYSSSPFSSNSWGSYGEIRLPDQEWQKTFVKIGPHVNQELSALSDIRRYFPRSHIQQLISYDIASKRLFFKLFRGKLLNEIRLHCYTNQGISRTTDRGKLVNWFLNIELCRAEQVTDAYRKTIRMRPDGYKNDGQPIHRFYYDRLESDSRFMEFYGKTISSICNGQVASATDFLNTPLIINGVSLSPLRHYVDQAQRILNPNAGGDWETFADLPVAFGLGDGHGGNVMVVENASSFEFLLIDYEVSGFHPPFLDMAKPLYFDGFFNVLYGDLLQGKVTDQLNEAGTMLSWTMDQKAIRIDYDVQVDEIGRLTTLAKLEYILRPALEYLEIHAPGKVQLALDVLANALLSCALLTRNFSTRPDIFFLNLALGVDLVNDMRGVLQKTFDWSLPTKETVSGSLISRDRESDFLKAFLMAPSRTDPSNISVIDLISLISSSGLAPEEVFLKRADETYQMQRRFSQYKNESSGMILTRIGEVRRLGMKIAPHTCIRESIFAEPRIDHHFAYRDILEGQKEADLLVDVGCCMGSDIRKLILDGFPADCITGLDIENRFFDLGKMLYNEEQNGAGPQFRQADLIDRNFARRHSDLANKFDLVHTANVLHLFDVEDQDAFFRNLVFLAKPGGKIWGRQVGLAADHPAGHRQPEGKGYRFTALEFRDWCLKVGGWSAAAAQFEGQLVQYDEIRGKRADKSWVLQWMVCVPREISGGRDGSLTEAA